MKQENLEVLTIKIDHTKPIELDQLSKSLTGFSRMYKERGYENAQHNDEFTLYVKDIKTGSIIIEIIALASQHVLPFAENINTLVSFFDFVSNSFSYLKSNASTIQDLTTKQLYNFMDIISPIRKDTGSSLVIANNNNTNITINYYEATAIHRKINNQIKSQESNKKQIGMHERVVLTLVQVNQHKASSGQKGIIESISNKQHTVIYGHEMLEDIVNNDSNPFKKGFLVDVSVESIKNATLYRVLTIHNSFELDE